ncbi:MAG: hypothetical protein IKU45_06735 [Clostridia bacterium]|nr:hypothetical protein [Clostridia bacterium]
MKTKFKKLKTLLLAVAVIAFAFVAVACGGSENSTSTDIDDYTLPPDISTDAPVENTEEVSEYVEETEVPATEPPATEPPATEPPVTENSNGIRAEFKTAMDSYEDFMNEYVDFMKKYQANPSSLSLLVDYAKYMKKYADFVKDYEAWEAEEMSNAELDYYIDVQTRVNKKLLEITG